MKRRTELKRILRKGKDTVTCSQHIVYYNKAASHVAWEIYKSKGWASQWLKKYKQEGIEGLKNKPKSGRRPEISSEIEYRIKTILRESSNNGWTTTKQVEEVIIIKESGIRYHHNYIYYIVRKWGFKQKVPRKVHVNTASKEEKEEFKKRPARYLWMLEVKKERKKKKGFAIVSLDESFFFYDSLVRRVWIDAKKRPIVRVTGSHKYSCLFGAISMDQKQLLRQYDTFNGVPFLTF